MTYDQELEEFLRAVKKLSSVVGSAADLWKDDHYKKLYTSVSQVSTDSRKVLEAGNKSRRSVERFEQIAREKY